MRLICDDVIRGLGQLEDESVHCCVTSPPYWGLRDYGTAGQLGLEKTPEEYTARMVDVFREVRRVLRDDGTVFLNLGDSYYGGAKYGNGDRPEPDSKADGSFSENLGGEHIDASQNRSLGILCPVHGRILESFLRSQGYISGQNVRLPNVDSTLQSNHSDDAIQGQRQKASPGVGPGVSFQSSKQNESSPQHQGAIPLSDSSSFSQGGVSGKILGEPQSSDKKACTCGIETLMDALSHHNSGKVSSVLAYPHFTTTSLKPKDLVGIPWRVAFALQADGWYLRSDIIWAKPNPMPESVTDRPTKAHEYIFLMSKSQKYYYDAEAIKEPSAYPGGPNSPQSIASPYGQGFTRNSRDSFKREESKRSEVHPGQSVGTHRSDRADNDYALDSRNKRSVWTVSTQPFPEAHFAVFPPKLIEPCVLAGCPEGGTVLDPFCGSGTTGIVSINNARDFVGIELNPEYVEMAKARIKRETAQQKMFV